MSQDDRVAQVDQTIVDALWLACRIEIAIGDVPRNLQRRAQLRLQRLCDAGLVKHEIGKYPTAIEAGEPFKFNKGE